jgi:uncharacterized protein YpmB
MVLANVTTNLLLLYAVTPFMEAVIVLLIGIIAPVVIFELLTYLHNKQVSQQLATTTTTAVQSVQNMVALAITSAQGMDITQRVLGEKQGQHQVIVVPQQQK